MSIWGRMAGIFGGAATYQASGDQISVPFRYSAPSAKSITEDTALQVSAVWACVRLLSETISSLPITVSEITGDDKTEVKEHSLYKLLAYQPNPRQTSQEWRETMMLNLVLHGNCYARIERASTGDIVALWPISAQQMQPKILQDGSIVYEYKQENRTEVYAERSILHIKLFGSGVTGLSPLGYARNTIGLASASEEYSSRYFVNGGKPSGILSIDKLLKPEQREMVREQFRGISEGAKNSHQLFVLEAGMQYQPIQINPDDMQMIETRRFQIEDIARFFGVPSFLINDTEKTTTWGTGIEQMMLGFYTLNLKPYITRWEQALHSKLLTPAQQKTYEIEFQFQELLRADSKGQADLMGSLVQNGLMTRNEGRRRMGLGPVTGGDDLTVQVNLVPISDLGKADEDKNPTI